MCLRLKTVSVVTKHAAEDAALKTAALRLKSFCLKASRPKCGGMTHGATRASVGARDGDGREAEGDEFAGKFPSAEGDDDVLLPIQHVGHGRAALRRGHVHGAQFLSGGFI